jgi:hypothetical protein
MMAIPYTLLSYFADKMLMIYHHRLFGWSWAYFCEFLRAQDYKKPLMAWMDGIIRWLGGSLQVLKKPTRPLHSSSLRQSWPFLWQLMD